MKVMLLAAGEGRRMRPLSETLPKPLLKVSGKTLIEHQLDRLIEAGFDEFVINLHHLGKMIEEQLGDGRARGVKIDYSWEARPLETGGGIKRALDLLGEENFVVISADTFCDFDFKDLKRPLAENSLGRLVMVANPAHHPGGDFGLGENGRLTLQGTRLTWASIAVFCPALVRSEANEVFTLRKVFDEAVADGRLEGMKYDGYWCDVGTIERYEALKAEQSRGNHD